MEGRLSRYSLRRRWPTSITYSKITYNWWSLLLSCSSSWCYSIYDLDVVIRFFLHFTLLQTLCYEPAMGKIFEDDDLLHRCLVSNEFTVAHCRGSYVHFSSWSTRIASTLGGHSRVGSLTHLASKPHNAGFESSWTMREEGICWWSGWLTRCLIGPLRT